MNARSLFVVCALVCFGAYTAQAYPSSVYGVDVSIAVSSDTFSCLVSNNLTFAIVRAFRSNGQPDGNAAANLQNAQSAGMQETDIYIFPCPKCGNGAGQIQTAVSNLGGATFQVIWLDIEQSQYWLGDQSSNQQFFEDLVNGAQGLGLTIGVYSSASQWNEIMGSDYTGGSQFPIWYAHYDGQPSFSDFQPFGGWQSPSMKQFSESGSKCGTSYDINWYPPDFATQRRQAILANKAKRQ